jgi:serine/threonine-protein kinase RsbW
VPTRTEQIPSTPEAASAACDLAEELAEAWGLPDRLRDAFLLVMGEAVDNAAGHGNDYDPSRTVRLTCRLEEGTLVVCVEDEGAGLQGTRLQEAALPDDPMAVDGRGLYIMRELADRVWLEAEGRRLCAAWTLPREEG